MTRPSVSESLDKVMANSTHLEQLIATEAAANRNYLAAAMIWDRARKSSTPDPILSFTQMHGGPCAYARVQP